MISYFMRFLFDLVKSNGKKYDRTVVVLLVTMLLMGLIYIKIDDIAASVVSRTPAIQELKSSKLVQNGINHQIMDALKDIQDDQKEIKRMLWRRGDK